MQACQRLQVLNGVLALQQHARQLKERQLLQPLQDKAREARRIVLHKTEVLQLRQCCQCCCQPPPTVKQLTMVEPQLLEACPSPHENTLNPLPRLQMQRQPPDAEAGQPLQLVVWQAAQSDSTIWAFLQVDVAHMLSMDFEVSLHAATPLQHCRYAAGHLYSRLVQHAMGPGGAEQAARVVGTAAQHLLQTGLRQLQQP
jgi:hypothetical protein